MKHLRYSAGMQHLRWRSIGVKIAKDNVCGGESREIRVLMEHWINKVTKHLRNNRLTKHLLNNGLVKWLRNNRVTYTYLRNSMVTNWKHLSYSTVR